MIVLGFALFLGAGMTLFNSFKATRRNVEANTSAMWNINNRRWVEQMVADDQLCAMTDFMDNLSGYTADKITAFKTVKEAPGLVDYSKIGIDKLKWPGSGDPESFTTGTTLDHSTRLQGPGVPTTLLFEQPPDSERKVVFSKDPMGREITRIPIDVRFKGTIGGVPALWDGAIETYIEMPPGSRTGTPVACYRPVSSRSLCLDAQGFFDPKRPKGKCQMP